MRFFHSLVALVLSLVTVVSCKKSETPDGGTTGVSGSFIGRVQFQSSSLSVDRSNRLIRILPDGGSESYKIEFFTGVPNITGVRFTKVNDSTWISNDTAKLKDVRIQGNLLKIDYQLEGQSWTVNDALRK